MYPFLQQHFGLAPEEDPPDLHDPKVKSLVQSNSEDALEKDDVEIVVDGDEIGGIDE
jgi:hypothetical protein